jgi:hypothetical protein
VLTRREDNAAERHHAFPFARLPDDCEGLLPDLAVWDQVVRIPHVKLVDLLPRNKLIDIDDARALDGDRFKFGSA